MPTERSRLHEPAERRRAAESKPAAHRLPACCLLPCTGRYKRALDVKKDIDSGKLQLVRACWAGGGTLLTDHTRRLHGGTHHLMVPLRCWQRPERSYLMH